jgi:uncharacterized protein (TIGR00369 family)
MAMSDERGSYWLDPPPPRRLPPGFLRMSGIERSRAFLEGKVTPPPCHRMTGVRSLSIALGEAVCDMPVSDWLCGSARVMPLGVMAYLADSPLGSAVISALGPGGLIATSEMSVSFLRPLRRSGGRITARASLVHQGRAYALSECRIEDQDGELVAFATARNLMLSIPLDEVAADEPAGAMPEAAQPPAPWEHPVRGATLPAKVLETMSGVEILRHQLSGELPKPPIAELFGTTLAEVEEGAVSLRVPLTPWCSGPLGRLYGGATALHASTAMAFAAFSTVAAGTAVGPLDLKVQFVRPLQADGRDMVVRATTVYRGKTLAVANAEVVSPDGKVAALATSTLLILPGFSWATDEWFMPAGDAEAV